MTFFHPRKMKAALLLLLLCVFFFLFLSIKEREQKTIFVGKAGEKAEWASTETEQSVIERSTGKKAQMEEDEEKSAKKPGEEKKREEKQTERSTTETNVTEAKESTNPIEEMGKMTVSKEKQSEGKININRASAEELQKLKGIGPSTAKSIILYREEYGAFSEIEEIMNVKRIGEKTFAKIKEQITVKEEE